MAIEPRDATPVTYKKLDQPTIEKEEFRNTFSPFGQYADVQYTHIERAIRTQNLLVPQVADREPETPLRGMIRYAIDPWHPLSSTAGDDGLVFFDGTDWQQIPFEVFTSLLNGIVPASGGGTVKFLRADATWATPPDTDTDTHLGVLLDTKATTSGANVSFTSIPATYDDLLLEFLGVSHNNAASNLTMQVSVNNGTSYTATSITGITRGSGTVTNSAVTSGAILQGATTASAAIVYGTLHIRQYKAAAAGYFNGFFTRSDAGFFDDFAGFINKSAAIDAIRINTSAVGSAFDAWLYGLKRA
jgi:hypothetical protein